MSPKTNPLKVAELFVQMNKDLQAHRSGSGGKAALVLRINSYSRLIAAHPDNTHDSRVLPSTEELMDTIDKVITQASSNASSSHELLVEAFTRIIVGRSKQNMLD